MTQSWKRSAYCGEVSLRQVGQPVVLTGWVQRRRDLGGVIFLDLRDRTGVVQVVVNPQEAPDVYGVADGVRGEFVVAVRGVVARRPEGAVNPKLATGEVEVRAQSLEVLNPSLTPPMHLDGETEVDEAVRLRYRYLDLRRPRMLANLQLRHRAAKAMRDYLDARGFLEVETPMLIKSTPEGARDFLVPSRLHPGKFYVLPQSPQLFKQLLMVAGIDRYVQFARCLRDEDLRADRQLEFTQVDIEMSFVGQDEVLLLIEQMMAAVTLQVMGIQVATPFPRLTYKEAMAHYGTDKPDLRFGLPIHDLTGVLGQSEFRTFVEAAAAGGAVRALVAPGCARYSRTEIDALTRIAVDTGGKGLIAFHVEESQMRSPAAKHFTSGQLQTMRERTQARAGDLILAVADRAEVASAVLGRLRLEFGSRLGLMDPTKFAYVWIVEFPLLEFSEEEGRFVAFHHPFTAPLPEDLPLLDTDPARVRSQQHDLVLNGSEIAGGSIRIHQRELQEQIFTLLQISSEDAARRFGFLLEAFQYGAPPHGGIAFGFDRLVMVLAGEETIRDVIAFPKTAAGTDLMAGAPSEVDDEQLRAVHIKVDRKADS